MGVTFRPSKGEEFEKSEVRDQPALRQSNENTNVNSEQERDQKAGNQKPRQSCHDGCARFSED